MRNSMIVRKDLVTAIASDTHEVNQVRAYLDLINAPDALTDPGTFLSTLREMNGILNLLPQIDRTQFPESRMERYRSIQADIYRYLSARLYQQATPRHSRDPLYGYYGSNPLFCVLATQVFDGNDTARYLHLKAQTLIASKRLDEIETKGLPVDSTRRNGCLGARQMGKEELKNLLKVFPLDPLPMDQFLTRIEAARTKAQHDYEMTVRGRLELLLKRAISGEGDSEAPMREPGPRGGDIIGPRSQPHSHPAFPLDCEEIPSGTALVSEADYDKEEEEHESIAEGDAAHEKRSRRVTLQVLEAPNPELSSAPADVRYRTRGFAAAIARRNQGLAIDLEVLPLREIEKLLKALGNKAHANPSSPIPFSALLAMIAILISTGFGLETALEIEVSDDPVAPTTDGPPILIRGSNKRPPYWLYRVREMPRVGNHPLLNRERPESLELPIALWVRQALNAHIKRLQRINATQVPSAHRLLFPETISLDTTDRLPELFETEIKVFLNRVNRKHKTHFTVRRLEWVFYQILTTRTLADRVDARLLTGRSRSLDTNDAYYIRRRKSPLIEFYIEGQRILVDAQTRASDSRDAALPASLDKKIKIPRPANDDLVTQAVDRAQLRDHGVGSPFCPDDSDVRRLVQFLISELQSARDVPPSKLNLKRLHNAMTVYTRMMSGFGLGFRAVSQPLKRWSDLDPETGLMVLLDKDAGDGYGARLVWVPDVVRTQLEHYQAHLLWLAERMGIGYPELQAQIYQALENTQAPHVPDAIPPFFLLDDKGKVHPCRPSLIRDHLTGFAPARYLDQQSASTATSAVYPLNACRHFLASQMRERGASEDLVCAFMGHWQSGEEPWAARSALSPMEFVYALAPIVTDLLQESGWVSQRGGNVA